MVDNTPSRYILSLTDFIQFIMHFIKNYFHGGTLYAVRYHYCNELMKLESIRYKSVCFLCPRHLSGDKSANQCVTSH